MLGCCSTENKRKEEEGFIAKQLKETSVGFIVSVLICLHGAA
jgi:hypothetical protein